MNVFSRRPHCGRRISLWGAGRSPGIRLRNIVSEPTMRVRESSAMSSLVGSSEKHGRICGGAAIFNADAMDCLPIAEARPAIAKKDGP